MKNSNLGYYRDQPNSYIRNAHYVCNRKFIKLFLPLIHDRSLWNINTSIFKDEKNRILNIDAPRMESMLTKYAGTNKTQLDIKCAARYSSKKENQTKIKELVNNICPQDVQLLSIDFPDIFNN